MDFKELTAEEIEEEIKAVETVLKIHKDQISHNEKGLRANGLILQLLKDKLSKVKKAPKYIG